MRATTRGWNSTSGQKYEQWLTDEGLERVEAWALEGDTNEQLAEKIGVSERTLRRWIAEHGAFAKAVARGRNEAVGEITAERVESALYKKALGYNVTEKVPMRVKKRVKDPQTGKWEDREVIRMVDRERHVPPDMKAVQFWLTNREKLRWQKSPEQDEDEEAVTVIIDV